MSDIHRNAIANFKPTLNDAHDINAWGLGLPPGTYHFPFLLFVLVTTDKC